MWEAFFPQILQHQQLLLLHSLMREHKGHDYMDPKLSQAKWGSQGGKLSKLTVMLIVLMMY